MGQLLGNVAVGSTVYLNENGSSQPYLVVHQGLPSSLYDESCDGTWLLRTNIFENNQWNFSGLNAWPPRTAYESLNKIYNQYDKSIQNIIKTVKIPYCIGDGKSTVNSGSNGYSCQMFLLGASELGISDSSAPIDGAKLDYFISGTSSNAESKRIANYNGSPYYWWLRSPSVLNEDTSCRIIKSGYMSTKIVSEYLGIRPALVMPQNLLVDSSNNIFSIPAISSLTAPPLAMVNQFILLSWSSVSVSGFDVTYQLQRNVNNGGWQNVGSPISQTSYTDTAQSGWTQVQYQVAAVIENVIGNYTQSSIIPVSDPSALVISGSDGNLGTLTSNVPYTVSSNTGNPISLTRTVNGAQVVTLTVESGFAYNIPIADLPTGTGTIQITASVKNGSETVTQTRTWIYYKTPINIPSTGGIAQLTQNGQNIWPITVPDAVEAPVYLGGNLNAALNKLGQAALYTKIGSPKYNQVTVDLSKVKVGDEVLLPYNDVMVPHIVVHIGNPDPSMYDSSCNGVWLLRKDAPEQGGWNPNGTNTLDGSTIITTMTGYALNYSSEVQNVIKTIKIPYCVGGGSSTVNSLANGLSCKLFPLSSIELGYTPNTTLGTFNMPVDGVNFSYFSSDSKRNLSNQSYWTRTPFTNNNNYAFNITETGGIGNSGHVNNARMGYNYCFIMPTTFTATYYVDSSNNIHPAQEYAQGGSITDVFGYDVPICQYETGSYVGTGTYGSGSPNSLTFSFEPKILFIHMFDLNSNSSRVAQFLNPVERGVMLTSSSSSSLTKNICSWSGNSISWYAPETSAGQLNTAGVTYYYFAIG